MLLNCSNAIDEIALLEVIKESMPTAENGIRLNIKKAASNLVRIVEKYLSVLFIKVQPFKKIYKN